MSNFNPNPTDPTDPNRVRASRDVVRDNQAIREQNIAMREQNRDIRENDSAATGLMLGVLLLGLAALGFGVYFMTQRPAPAPTRTIIERDRTTTVPAQPSAPPNVNVTVPNPAPPNVNVTIPESAPRVAPSAAPSPVPSTAPSNADPQTAPTNP
ncbi:hypothetical protein [Stenomitos frigidus]|uniref:Uncharacterized protein n=1 Tax=Stenomitos frigidus ULC18 TaxID=2107698 RepID=A0A2T1E206_9CYAN|nr:hypothetical protein [Stenomitos frigidus]PSB26793.1 hypothetical protein C7B82_18205 [Stenomitos frigidus ULC18]